MLNLSQTVVDNLSPEGRLEVAAHALSAADATIRDLAEQLLGSKVLLRATNAALRSSQAHVDQLLEQVKEQATTIRGLNADLIRAKGVTVLQQDTIDRKAQEIRDIHQAIGTSSARCLAKGYHQAIDLLTENRMWDILVGTAWSAEIDDDILAGRKVRAIKRVRAQTGFTLLLCKNLVEERAQCL